MLKYKTKVFGKDLVLLNFTNYASIQDQFLPTGDAFINMFYDEFTAALALNKKWTIIANAGFEKVNGSDRIQMANEDGTEVKDYTVDLSSKKKLDQVGTVCGFGIDYDFTKNAGIHFRHKWMNHEDLSFTADKFSGTETSVELKMWF